MSREQQEALLDGLRVLDLADEKGLLCGRLLGDLGADVIKVERPGGDRARNIGPFYHDIPDPEKSLYWFAYNTNKRGITLDIETADGQDLFRRLVQSADFVVESFTPGYLEGLGLGYQDLSQLNPRLILTSITPFGQTGPHCHYRGPDLVNMARGGLMYLCGSPDRPPVRISFPQSYCLAGAEAAVASMVAYYEREISGQSQHVDVSIQEAVVWTMMNASVFWDMNRVILRRAGQYRVGLSSGARQRHTWPCKDGYVSFVVLGAASGARTMKALVQWLEDENLADEPLGNIDWDNFSMAAADQEFHDQISPPIAELFCRHTKAELYEGAISRRLMLYPITTSQDLLESPQLKARGYWIPVEHPELGDTLTYPGGWVKSPDAMCHIRRRPPLIGEHNQEVYAEELGLSAQDLALLRQAKII